MFTHFVEHAGFPRVQTLYCLLDPVHFLVPRRKSGGLPHSLSQGCSLIWLQSILARIQPESQPLILFECLSVPGLACFRLGSGKAEKGSGLFLSSVSFPHLVPMLDFLRIRPTMWSRTGNGALIRIPQGGLGIRALQLGTSRLHFFRTSLFT